MSLRGLFYFIFDSMVSVLFDVVGDGKFLCTSQTLHRREKPCNIHYTKMTFKLNWETSHRVDLLNGIFCERVWTSSRFSSILCCSIVCSLLASLYCTLTNSSKKQEQKVTNKKQTNKMKICVNYVTAACQNENSVPRDCRFVICVWNICQSASESNGDVAHYVINRNNVHSVMCCYFPHKL
jgi:hypothetical protein